MFFASDSDIYIYIYIYILYKINVPKTEGCLKSVITSSLTLQCILLTSIYFLFGLKYTGYGIIISVSFSGRGMDKRV